jgi:hypothetical protein
LVQRRSLPGWMQEIKDRHPALSKKIKLEKLVKLNPRISPKGLGGFFVRILLQKTRRIASRRSRNLPTSSVVPDFVIELRSQSDRGSTSILLV